MRYLILDKRQRITQEKTASADIRIMEELDKKNIPHTLAYFDELEFEFLDGETCIKVKGEDIRKYSHIIFRGHDLHSESQYQLKRYIVEYTDQYNINNPENKILVQNSKTIKKLPYYNKIALALFCHQNNIPYFNSYYRTDGNYLAPRDILNSYPLILKSCTGENRIEEINGKELIKKNVFKIDTPDDFKKNNIKNLDLSNMFIQELSDSDTDIRVFVKKGEIIGGWKRKKDKSFMTVSKGIYSMYNNPEEKIKNFVQKVTRIFEADFIAVDIMEMHGKPLLQEISLHPGFKAYETKIKGEPVNIAEAIITAFSD